MSKLVCMGEALIDFLPDAPGSMNYSGKPGGAPANVAACAARLGARSCYFGKLSEDALGRFLSSEMERCGVDLSLAVWSGDVKTGIVLVSLSKNGDRDFFFYRDNPADELLRPEEVPEDLFEPGDILHFCSFDLVECPAKHAHEKAILQARERGALVSFDVNERLHFWKDEDRLRDTCFEFVPLADLIKVTDGELAMLTGTPDEREGARVLFETAPNARLLFVTKGKGGSSVYDRSLSALHFEAKGERVVDTTGAGDCYVGTVLYKLLAKEAVLTLSGIEGAVRAATAACAVVIAEKGAMNAMPDLSGLNEAVLKYYGRI